MGFWDWFDGVVHAGAQFDLVTPAKSRVDQAFRGWVHCSIHRADYWILWAAAQRHGFSIHNGMVDDVTFEFDVEDPGVVGLIQYALEHSEEYEDGPVSWWDRAWYYLGVAIGAIK